jgi:hypothetical protein
MEIINPESTVTIQEQTSSSSYKTPSYTLNAIKRYQEKNKEKLNQYAKNRWREKYDNDPEFREKHKQRSLARYHKLKLESQEHLEKNS